MNHPLRALRGTLLISLSILRSPRARRLPRAHPHPDRHRDSERCRDRSERVRDGDLDGDSTATGGGACTPEDLALTGGAWGAAAGSRGAEVSVENRGSAACTLPASPSVAVLDAAGTAIIESPPPTDETGPTLEPWRDHIRDPVQQLVRRGDGAPAARRAALGVRGHPDPGSRHDRRRFPPCNGPRQPASLSANPWQPVEG